MRGALWLSVVMTLVACKGGADRTTQQLEELQKKKEADAKAKKEDKLAPLPTDVLTLDAPYDDRQSERIAIDGPCPEGLWALFPGDAPGSTPDEKKANAAKRKELADALKSKQFLVKLRGGGGVTLKPYDPVAGQFTFEVGGTIDCNDSLGRIAIAWSDAKATNPSASAIHEGSELTQNVWTAAPVTFRLPMTSQLEAKTFEQQTRIAVSARVVFKLGKVEVDKKLKKVGKVKDTSAGEAVGYGGGVEDWGAGRLVHAELVGLRVATDRERKQLFDLRGAP